MNKLKICAAILGACFVFTNAHAQQMDTHHHANSADAANSPEIVQDWAKQKLAQSPRHHECSRTHGRGPCDGRQGFGERMTRQIRDAARRRSGTPDP